MVVESRSLGLPLDSNNDSLSECGDGQENIPSCERHSAACFAEDEIMEAGSLPTTNNARGPGRIIAARRRIEDLPVWLFALLTVVCFNAIALGGLVCTRRFGQSVGLYTLIDNDTVGWIFSAILVMYAISLGLIAVASWGNTSAAAAAASAEAAHIATVYRTLGGYPQPLQGDLKDSVVRYTQSIIETAWPAQRRGEITEAGIEIILHLWSRILEFEPATEGQRVVHAQMVGGFNTLVEFRRRRIEATSYAVPGPLWSVVLIGAAVSIFGSYLFKIQSFSGHGLLTILLTTMIALLVFFIATTDHPYSGSNAIEPLPYEIVLKYLQDYN